MSERGLAESTQWALLVPVLLAMILGLIQTGIWLHGRTVAASAALTAAEQIAWARSDQAQARLAADRVAAAGGLVETSVAMNTAGAEVRVTVSARVPTFFDLGQGRLREVAVLPLERVSRP